jgi:hypothetical protein
MSAGIDCAGPREDETTLHVVQGGTIIHRDAWTLAESRGALVAALTPFSSSLGCINIDAVGLGWGYYLHLKDHFGDVIRPINVGEAPTGQKRTDQVRFRDLKAEVYWDTRAWLAEGMVDGLTVRLTGGQLASVRYAHDHDGRVVIESKEQAIRRRAKSPDRAESLVLALWRNPHATRRAIWGTSRPITRHGRC